MRSWWDEKAADVQQGVRSDESQLDQQYTEEEARRATVHAREDIVMIVSHLSSANRLLSSANRLLASIRLMLIALIIVVVVIGLKLTHYW
jgi:K+-sensing histidine kinase KdpD